MTDPTSHELAALAPLVDSAHDARYAANMERLFHRCVVDSLIEENRGLVQRRDGWRFVALWACLLLVLMICWEGGR